MKDTRPPPYLEPYEERPGVRRHVPRHVLKQLPPVERHARSEDHGGHPRPPLVPCVDKEGQRDDSVIGAGA